MGMNKWRILLFPFSLIYGAIIIVRNKLFDWNVLETHQIGIPSIGVGNLSVGGTGKSVVIDFLITNFKKEFDIAVLSRGYGRTIKGVIVADELSSAATIGDEPFQFFMKHQGIDVVVAEERMNGLQKLNEIKPQLDLLLLDDVMQHRYVAPSVLIMTTTYEKPYFSDWLMPVGKLREVKSGAQRAQIILVTKSPEELSEEKIKSITEKFNLTSFQKLFFTKIRYSTVVQNHLTKIKVEELKEPFILVTGVADPSTLVNHLQTKGLNFKHLEFSDHHLFTPNDVAKITKIQRGGKVVTTEKDYTRLSPLMGKENLFYLPIEMEFLNPEMATQFMEYLKQKTQIN